MMKYDFDEIKDLPVSEEMLGAYMEGNLNSWEADMVETVMNQEPLLQDIFQEVTGLVYEHPLEISEAELYNMEMPFASFSEHHPELEPEDSNFREHCDISCCRMPYVPPEDIHKQDFDLDNFNTEGFDDIEEENDMDSSFDDWDGV